MGLLQIYIHLKLLREGTYSILKNEDYAKNTTKCELFLIITTDMYTYGRKQAIWMEDKYLRIVPQSSGIPSNEYSGGEASIRYKKRIVYSLVNDCKEDATIEKKIPTLASKLLKLRFL